MMSDDIHIRIDGRAGRITLNRPAALNALTYDMVKAIDRALIGWRHADINLVLIDAAGDKAFCAGGDIADMYTSGLRGDLDYGRQFWRDEYALNARISQYPKPVVTFLQGFTMGGGVGVGCHGAHRIVDDTSQIAMPECTIGLVPDVGGSLLLAQAPGFIGTYLGLTGDRMTAADAIYAGFADHYIPGGWQDLKAQLVATGDVAALAAASLPAPDSRLAAARPVIDAAFGGANLGGIMKGLTASADILAHAAKLMRRNAPLAMAVATQIIQRVRTRPTISHALEQEFQYTYRAVAQGDFIEGIRAAIIDKDRQPKWAHQDWTCVTDADVIKMTAPLGADGLQLEDPT